MFEWLSSNVWQGIGVLTSIVISLVGFIYTTLLKNRIFKSRNSKFYLMHEATTELLEGQSVEVIGRVREELFPGPPNYSSIDNGDIPQFYWILYTNTPIGIVGRSFENEQPYDLGKSCSFQLVVDAEFYDNKADIVGKLVKVRGRTLIGHTGHHKTKALIEVETIKSL